ncbi:MAG: membrane protein insertase YidC, partial [Methylophilaceae bacterium]|nr:membrane protein insertase YidC [Methylophilaceae bacterium]
DVRRLILFVVLSFSILFFWSSWQERHAPQVAQQVEVNQPQPASVASANEKTFQLSSDKRVTVETDVFKAEIDTMGGDIRRIELLKHHADYSNKEDLVLLDDRKSPLVYVAQSGLIGKDLPTHKTVFTAETTSYQLKDNQNEVVVTLNAENAEGVKVTKTYTFTRGSYAVKVGFKIDNASNAAIDPWIYYQIVHDSESNQGTKMMPTFTGAAYFTDADKYKKVKFTEMAKEDLSKNAKDGWIGLVQHYFVSAWIPATNQAREFYTNKLGDKVFAIGAKSGLGMIAPGASKEVSADLYMGPQTHDELVKTAPGLEYTVDYGWLTFIASPLFMVLSAINSLVHNWGVAIILLTILIKLAFYPLSAAGYRNMAQMRELAPRLQSMKEKFGDDRQKMQQAMMELYKKEKINPMGGCLPILIQIPVFISLYWMLLGSVEMRHAPFMLWIQDLSAPDTLFGSLPEWLPLLGGMPIGLLPILMAATMLIQTKLNPKPTDPVQAKVMLIMPIVFSIFFFFFPAGLVLYWLVNNILSIAQQARINHLIHAGALAKKKGNAAR